MKNNRSCFAAFLALFLVNMICFGQQTLNKSFVHDGITRTYSIYIPATYQASTAVPLILNLHGHGSSGQQQAFYSNFQAIADTANFILVHPDGTINPTSEQAFWNIGILGVTVDDISFLSDLVDTVSAHYAILQDRIYSTGMSNGGYMSYVLACQTTKFRAIGSVTGSMTNYMYNNCGSAPGIPVIQIHGTSDVTVPYNGNTTNKSIEDVVAFWVNKNNCNTTPIVTQIPNTNTTDGATAERFLYSGGTDNHTVELFKVTGGGHSWPGAISLPTLGNTCQDFSATKEIWRFFNQYSSNQQVNVDQLEDLSIEIYPNPSTGIIHIKHKKAIDQIKLFDNTGRFLSDVQLSNDQTIDLSTFSSGSYLLELSGNSSTKTIRISLQ